MNEQNETLSKIVTSLFYQIKLYRNNTKLWNLPFGGRKYLWMEDVLIYFSFFDNKLPAYTIFQSNINHLINSGRSDEVDQILKELPIHLFPRKLLEFMLKVVFDPAYQDKIKENKKFFNRIRDELQKRKQLGLRDY